MTSLLLEQDVNSQNFDSSVALQLCHSSHQPVRKDFFFIICLNVQHGCHFVNKSEIRYLRFRDSEFGRSCYLDDHLISKEHSEYHLDSQHRQCDDREAWQEWKGTSEEPTHKRQTSTFCFCDFRCVYLVLKPRIRKVMWAGFSWPSICKIFLFTCPLHHSTFAVGYLFYNLVISALYVHWLANYPCRQTHKQIHKSRVAVLPI